MAGLLALALFGCNENNLSGLKFDAIAVVQGDFDNVEEPLVALDIATQPFDGFIVQATYEPEDERQERGYGAPDVESLLTAVVKNRIQIELFNAVFINSGTRGLGVAQYNDTLEPDDSLLTDPEALDHVCSFVESGGTLVVSDWAYEVVEHCWPDEIEFFGDDTVADSAQVGMPDHDILADVNDDTLKEQFGSGIDLTLDFSAWSVMESAASDVEVLLSADVEYQPSADELAETLSDAPLMVRFQPKGGQVVYTSFHWRAQQDTLAQALLLATVEGLDEGAGSDEPVVQDTGS